MMTRFATGAAVRQMIRRGELTSPTPGIAGGYVQANLVVVPQEFAFEFLLFCQRNPKACPVLDVCDAGDPEPARIAPGADIRTDLSAYRVFRNGEVIDEPHDIVEYWRPDLVSFLIGCSFTFENALLMAGLPVRHIEQARNVPMYRTKIACQPAGRFRGPMVVSMRPMSPTQAIQAVRITSRYPMSHGGPVHVGDPAQIGISDLNAPDYGDAVEVRPGEIPVFWACGVTPQAVVAESRLPFVIAHKPGHMFVSDLRDSAQDCG